MAARPASPADSRPHQRPARTVDRAAASLAIENFLRAIGHDPSSDPELAETAARVTETFVDELCSGYAIDVDALIAENVIAGGTSVVVVRGIHVTTTCPHHLMPATGTADVAFAPAGKLIGVGAIARVVHACARRLVLQEALGEAIVSAIERGLAPTWTACRLDLAHGCFVARGERQLGARVASLALRGNVAKAEALAVLGGLGSAATEITT